MRLFVFALIGALALATVSCNDTTQLGLPGADQTCVAGSAQIAIGDGNQEILCGCQEPGGQVLGAGLGTLTCTVPVGTTVFFYFLATYLTHQLGPTSGSAFPASAVSNPADGDETIRAVVFKPQSAGTYGYMDMYVPGVVGQIIAL